MKVLLIAKSGDRPECAMHRGLVAAGVDVTLVCDNTYEPWEEMRNLGIPVTVMGFKSRVDLSAIRRIRKIAADGNFDIIHSFTSRALSNALLATYGTKVIHVAYRGAMGGISRIDPGSWLAYTNSRVKAVCCVCNAVKDSLLKCGFKESRLPVIYKGHALEWYTNLEAPDIASEFGIPDNAVKVCFTGNLRPVKGADTLLEAAELLPSDIPAHILIVGAREDRNVERMVKKLKRPDRIHFTGRRKDAAGITGKCDIFVMPSRCAEGLPKAVIEAMSQGIPPIVTDAGGMPELVLDGECGLIVPSEDPAALAKAITELVNDPEKRKRMGERARRRIKENFNIKTTIEQTLDLYRRLTSSS